jgi:outer membrane murein-binding lipoprotein Lpp
MVSLINILIIFFLFLLSYQLFLANHIIEGLDNQYKNYDNSNPNNALILAQHNAGNIEYLKERINDVQGINQQVQDLSGNVQNLQSQVDDLVQAQKEYADQMTGGAPLEVTGATDEEDDTEDTNLE